MYCAYSHPQIIITIDNLCPPTTDNKLIHGIQCSGLRCSPYVTKGCQKRIRIKRCKILWLLFFCTGLEGKFGLSHPILKYSETSETASGVKIHGVQACDKPWRWTTRIRNMHGLYSLFFFFFFYRSNSVIGIVNIVADIIEEEQCYFSCENGEYRMFIRDNL